MMFRTRLPLLYLSFSVCALAITACGDTERGELVDETAATAEGPTCSLESLRELPNVFYIGTEIQWTENTFGVKDIPDLSGFAPPGQSIAASTDELFATIMIEWVF